MCRIHPGGLIVACTLLTIAFGCSTEDLGNLVDKAKNAASEGTEKVKEAVSQEVESVQEKMGAASTEVQEQLSMAGTIELTAGAPLKTDACYARLIAQGARRPAVLQLQSYRDANSESFPSVFLQSQVEVSSPSELVGKIVSARLFVQRDAQGSVLFSETESPVELRIVSLEEKLLSAELVAASLLDTATGESVAATGRFEGVLP